MEGATRLPNWVEWLAWAGAAVALVLYLGFATNGFWGDDWELRAQAVRGASPAAPISSHLRPMVRTLFLLLRRTDSPVAFHVISILLHIFAAVAAYSLTAKLYDPRTGRLAALCFFAAFPANEAVYWASAVGVVTCLLFSLLALRSWAFGRPMFAAGLLIPAAMSYELWLVAIPLCFLIRRGRPREWIPTLAVFSAFAVTYMRSFGAAGASAYGGWKWTALPERLATYAYHFLAPTSATVGTMLALALLSALVAAVLRVPALRFPVVLYLSSTIVLAFAESQVTVSRFSYFPQFALVLIILLLKDTGRVGRWIGISLAVYVLLSGPAWNFIDGRDYRDLASFYSRVAAKVSPALATAAVGDSFGFLNQTTPEPLITMVQSFRGRPKTAFVRAAALYGAVYLPDIVTLELRARGLAPKENQTCTGRRFEIGSGAPVGRYCFDVVASGGARR